MYVVRAELQRMRNDLFRVCAAAEYGTFFPWVSLQEILGADPKRYRHIIAYVGKQLELQASRILISVPREGYKVAEPAQFVDVSQRRQHSSRRKLQSALRVVKATPLPRLSPEERRRHDIWTSVLEQQIDAMHAIRKEMATSYKKVDTLIEAQMTELAQRIQRLEMVQTSAS